MQKKIQRFLYILIFITALQLLLSTNNTPDWLIPMSTALIALLFIIEFTGSKQTLQNNQKQSRYYNPSTDLDTAKRVQEALLAIDPPETERVTIVKRCIPASTLGGDFYTFINKTLKVVSKKAAQPGIVELLNGEENIIGVTIGDVAGHGVSSALVMALSSGLLGRIGLNNRSPSVILQRANVDIQKFISQSQISHVTAFYSNINLDAMTFTYSNAGHPPAIIIHKDLSVERLTTNGIFLGMYPDEIYEEKETALKPGDRILLYTDGIIETVNTNHENFGTKRLTELAIKHKEKPSQEVMDIIFEELSLFRKGNKQKDDETLIIIDVK